MPFFGTEVCDDGTEETTLDDDEEWGDDKDVDDEDVESDDRGRGGVHVKVGIRKGHYLKPKGYKAAYLKYKAASKWNKLIDWKAAAKRKALPHPDHSTSWDDAKAKLKLIKKNFKTAKDILKEKELDKKRKIGAHKTGSKGRKYGDEAPLKNGDVVRLGPPEGGRYRARWGHGDIGLDRL